MLESNQSGVRGLLESGTVVSLFSLHRTPLSWKQKR